MTPKNIIIGLVIIGILAVGAVYVFRSPSSSTNTNVSATTNLNASQSTNSTMVTLTTSEIAQHNSQSDCWIVVSGGVFDVTSYLPAHPSGSFRIVPYCGQDATTAFTTQGGEGQHSSTAMSDLQQLKIGNLNGQISSDAL